MRPSVREAGLADVEAMAFLHWQGWPKTYMDFIPPDVIARRTLARCLVEWRQRVSGGVPLAFVAEDQDSVVRAFIHACRRSPRDDGCDLEIGYLYVDPSCHRSGLGRQLLKRLAEAARREGLRSCLVVAFAGNPYRHAYARLGARLDREVEIELEGWRGVDAHYVWDDFPSAFGA